MFSEGFGVVAELDDFSGADEGEVQWIEKEQQPFGFVVSKGELLEFVSG